MWLIFIQITSSITLLPIEQYMQKGYKSGKVSNTLKYKRCWLLLKLKLNPVSHQTKTEYQTEAMQVVPLTEQNVCQAGKKRLFRVLLVGFLVFDCFSLTKSCPSPRAGSFQRCKLNAASKHCCGNKLMTLMIVICWNKGHFWIARVVHKR